MANANDEISIKELFNFVWATRFKFVLGAISVAAISVTLLLMLPNKFKSEMVVFAINKSGDNSMLQGLAGQFGGLASMAGVNLNSDDDDSVIAKHTLTSRTFLLGIAKQYDFVPYIIAAAKIKDDQVLFDENLYDAKGKVWNSDAFEGKSVPSDTEIFEEVKRMYSVSEDPNNGTLKVSFEHVSPKFAMEFLLVAFKEINSQMRERAFARSEMRLEYLIAENEKAKVASVKQVLSQLIEAEINKKLLIDTEPAYAFEMLDSPFVPDEKSSPLRALILILVMLGYGFIFLAFCGLAFVFRPFSK